LSGPPCVSLSKFLFEDFLGSAERLGLLRDVFGGGESGKLF
jgi:hypothetical protein